MIPFVNTSNMSGKYLFWKRVCAGFQNGDKHLRVLVYVSGNMKDFGNKHDKSSAIYIVHNISSVHGERTYVYIYLSQAKFPA